RKESPMRFVQRKPRSPDLRRRGVYRPTGEDLEPRMVLTAIDLANVAATTAPGPYGVQLNGASANQGAGWSITDIGNVNGSGFDSYVIGAPLVVQSGNTINLAPSGFGTAYLVFGSQFVNYGTLVGAQRVGALANLGTNTAGNSFDGITIT